MHVAIFGWNILAYTYTYIHKIYICIYGQLLRVECFMRFYGAFSIYIYIYSLWIVSAYNLFTYSLQLRCTCRWLLHEFFVLFLVLSRTFCCGPYLVYLAFAFKVKSQRRVYCENLHVAITYIDKLSHTIRCTLKCHGLSPLIVYIC